MTLKQNMKKRIVILGGGESGVGAAVLAHVKGYDTFLSDSGKVAQKYAARLGLLLKNCVARIFQLFQKLSLLVDLPMPRWCV